MPLIKPVIRNGIIIVGLASTLFFAHTVQAVWNGQPYTPGSTLNPECSPTQINCTVAPYTLQNITDQGYTTNRPIRVNGVSTTANILPTSNNLYDLGEVSNYWHKLFAKNVSSTNIDALGYVSTTALWVNGSPVTSNVPTLQQVTNQGYFTTHQIGFTGASSTGNIIPTTNGSFDLGSATKSWKNIYASSTLYAVNGKFIDPSAGGTPLSSAVNGDTMFQVNQYGVGIGNVAPSNPDDFVHIERNNNTATGILVYNRQESVTADSFIHLFAGVPASGGADLRITAKPGAAGGYVNLTAQNNTGLNIMNNSAAPINFYTSSTQQGFIDAAGNMTLGSTAGKNTDNSLKITNNSAGASARAVLQVLSDDAYFSINAYGTGGGDFVNLFAGGSNTGLNILNGASSPISFYTGGAVRSKIDASGFSPGVDNTYDLGTSSLYWKKLFVKHVSSTNIDADGYISTSKLLINGTEVIANPNFQQVTDQGATTNKWIRFAGATSTGSINPTITNSYDLGSNTNAWRGIYASSTLDVGSSFFKVDFNGAAIGDGAINNKLSINQLNTDNALLKLSSSASTPGLAYAAAIDFYSNYPGTTDTFNFGKIYTRSDCGLWICGRLTLSVRDNNGDLMNGLTLKGSPNEAGKIDIGIGTTNPYLYRLTVAGTIAPSSTNSYDLGSYQHAWRSAYASSTIYSGNSQGSGNFSFATSGYMYANATQNTAAAFVLQNKATGAGALLAVADNLSNYPLLINNYNNSFFGWTPSIGGSNRVIIAGNANRADGDLGFVATSTDNSNFYHWSIGVDKTDGGRFKISSSTVLGTNDRLTIDGNGNVGIGTSNPSNFKLQIAGNVGPDANLTYDLGSSDNRWKDLYVSSTHIGTSTWDLWQANTGFTISRGLENQYITVSNNGNLGIGTTIPDQGRVEVKGDTVCVDTNNDGNASSCIANESDARLKKNTLEIDGALNKIMQLTGVTYDWKTDDPEVLKHYPLISRFKGHEHTVGLIAQDVQKIFPEALSLETVGDKDVQYFQLDYTKFTPLIIEAIKEQQDQINSLKENQSLFANTPLGPMQPVVESQAGQAKFLLSQDVIPVIFKLPFNDIPVVTVTPMDKIEGPYWIEKVSATGFEIHLAFAQPKDVIFNWQALYNNNQSFPDYINPPPDYTPAPDPSPTVTTTPPAPTPTTTSTPSSEPVDVPVTTAQDQATSTSN